MTRRLIFLMLCMTLSFSAMGQQRKNFTLVIDAGHGGKDCGARGKQSLEKNINLKTALAFGQLVERNMPDVKVIYTRKTDVFVTLSGRAEIANKAKADLFISIHTNAMPKGRISRGIETYTLGMHRAADNLEVAKRENSVILVEDDYKTRYQGFDPNSSESYIIFELMQDVNMERSVALAKSVQTNLCRQTGRQNKGVKQAGFLVLRETSMPSCLIELGFISTPDEESQLINPTHVDAMARGIYNAFAEYRKKYAPSSVKTIKKIEDPQPEVATISNTESQDQPSQQEQTVTESQQSERTEVPKSKQQTIDTAEPVFKVQILTSSSKLKATDSRLKGLADYDFYRENGILKYTSGASTNYNEIYRLRKQLLEKFPEAFIIAFKNGEKMDVRQAIQEFKENKKR